MGLEEKDNGIEGMNYKGPGLSHGFEPHASKGDG